MAQFSLELNDVMAAALDAAEARAHRVATLEHLLAGLLDDKQVTELIELCGAPIAALRARVAQYLDGEGFARMSSRRRRGADVAPEFQRVVHRGFVYAAAIGCPDVSPVNVLMALCVEKESHAVAMLQGAGVFRDKLVTIRQAVTRRGAASAS